MTSFRKMKIGFIPSNRGFFSNACRSNRNAAFGSTWLGTRW